MVVQSPSCWNFDRDFQIPIVGQASPEFPVSGVVVFDCHSVSTKIAQTLDPLIIHVHVLGGQKDVVAFVDKN
jgi:hypothetical protein